MTKEHIVNLIAPLITRYSEAEEGLEHLDQLAEYLAVTCAKEQEGLKRHIELLEQELKLEQMMNQRIL